MLYFFLLVLRTTVVIGLEATFYTVGESDAVVEICVNAAGANSSCPSSVPFQVLLSAFSPSAGNGYIFIIANTVFVHLCPSALCLWYTFLWKIATTKLTDKVVMHYHEIRKVVRIQLFLQLDVKYKEVILRSQVKSNRLTSHLFVFQLSQQPTKWSLLFVRYTVV